MGKLELNVMKPLFSALRNDSGSFVKEEDSLKLGESETGEIVSLPIERMATHQMITGVTGCGKTGYILALLYQLFLRDCAVVMVDPVGTMFKKCLEWLAALRLTLTLMARSPYPAYNAMVLGARDKFFSRFAVIDFADETCSGVFYNPIAKTPLIDSSSELAWQFLKVFERASQGDISVQLRRQLMVHSALALVAEANGTVCDAHLLLTMSDEEIKALIQHLVNRAETEGRKLRLEFVRDFMERFFATLGDRQREEWTASSWTAFGPFLNDERIYRFLASPKSNIDFEDICNAQKILLVHLPRGRGLHMQRFLGSLVVERVKTICMRRTPDQVKKRVVLVLDEFHLLWHEEWATDIATHFVEFSDSRHHWLQRSTRR
jgi:hypothetical protein